MTVDAGAAGGAPPPAGGAPAGPPAPAPSAELGAAGIAALNAERDRANRAEAELKTYRDNEEAARVAALSEHEAAIEAARKEGQTLAEQEFAKRELSWRIRQAATVGIKGEKDALLVFHDPADAELFVQGLKPEATEAEVSAALLKLATEKPHLVKGATPPPPIRRGPAADAGLIEGGQDNTDKQGDDFLRNLRNKTGGESLTL